MQDKKKILILIAIISFIVFVLIISIIIAILSFNSDNKEPSKLNTTSRRTYSTTSTSTTTTTKTPETSDVITTNKITTTTSKKKETTTTTKDKTTKATKKTTSKTTKTTKKTTEEVIIPEPSDRETTESNSTYPNALDSWEWEVVDAINEERRNNGLNELEVAVDLRRLAEEAADFWYEYSDEEIEDYLDGYSYYGYKSNVLDNLNGHESLFNAAKNNTKVTTNKYLRYLGVGVIYRTRGISGLRTHYFIIIYE